MCGLIGKLQSLIGKNLDLIGIQHGLFGFTQFHPLKNPSTQG